MAVSIKELMELERGDLIQASDLYYRVYEARNDGLVLSDPFAKGEVPKGKWVYNYHSQEAKYDFLHWKIIPACTKESQGIVGIIKRNDSQFFVS